MCVSVTKRALSDTRGKKTQTRDIERCVGKHVTMKDALSGKKMITPRVGKTLSSHA